MGGTQRAAVSSVSACNVRLSGVRNNRNTLHGTKSVGLILSMLGSSRDKLRNNSTSLPGAAIRLSHFTLRLPGSGCIAGKAEEAGKGHECCCRKEKGKSRQDQSYKAAVAPGTTTKPGPGHSLNPLSRPQSQQRLFSPCRLKPFRELNAGVYRRMRV